REFLTDLQHPWVEQTRQKLKQSQASLMADLTVLLADQGDVESAIAYARRALHLNPQMPDLALYTLRLHQKMGRVEEVIPCIQQILQQAAPLSEEWKFVRVAFNEITQSH
ncbi:MAG: tetratricopeptide repeat protein, partial [Anaerolineae bacterium]|nr:tetratricopeptide repeat protein [Anaerolineae bacterium]